MRMKFEPVKLDVEKLVGEIARKLKDSVNAEEIIERPKIKKEYGCLQLKVGGYIIPIR